MKSRSHPTFRLLFGTTMAAALALSPLAAECAGAETGSQTATTAAALPDPAPKPAIPAIPDSKGLKLTRATTSFEIKAPRDLIWSTLTNFDNYPAVFKRIESCKVTRVAGDQMYLETCLKPQMFVKQPVQHSVIDLSGKPNQMRWWLVDGNFKHCEGLWELNSAKDGVGCKITYTIKVDAGRFIPGPLVGFLLHLVQNEAAQSLKKSSEHAYSREQAKSSESKSSI
ncbi:MAG TPA: SRPBCC family protein [Chroococcales cyanobacterium]